MRRLKIAVRLIFVASCAIFAGYTVKSKMLEDHTPPVITCKDKTWFAYSDKEKADIVKALEGKKYKIDRSKGLGENDPDMMSLTTMNPDTRRLIRVMPAEAEATAQVFDLLLGDNLAGRKDHIAENGYKYVYRYADSAVQLEVYEFPAELSETAKALQDAVRADGTFKVLDNTVPGYLSNDGRFLLIYTDAKSEKEDANKTHKEHVLECFNTFADAKAK